jgi:8-oxo-dGTP pyrophosphatase MutT (NUDIX family)
MNTQMLPYGEWFASLPRKQVSAGILFFDTDGRLLIVKPSYCEWWQIPGGVVEAGESPRAGAVREIHEEIGIDISAPALVTVIYNSDKDNMRYLFDGGVLTPDQQSHIHIDGTEIIEYKFVTIEEASRLLGPGLNWAIEQCANAVTTRIPIYLES